MSVKCKLSQEQLHNKHNCGNDSNPLPDDFTPMCMCQWAKWLLLSNDSIGSEATVQGASRYIEVLTLILKEYTNDMRKFNSDNSIQFN